jgi:hypothetical protein
MIQFLRFKQMISQSIAEQGVKFRRWCEQKSKDDGIQTTLLLIVGFDRPKDNVSQWKFVDELVTACVSSEKAVH